MTTIADQWTGKPARRGGKVATGVLSGVLAAAVLAPMAIAAPLVNPTPGDVNPAPSSPNPTPAVPVDVPPVTQGPGAIPDPPSNSWRPNPWTDNGPTVVPTFNGTDNTPPAINAIFSRPAPPMILPQPGMLRVGTYEEVKPTWMTMAELNSINRWSAYTESKIAQFWRSQGFSDEEADRRAATMLVGGAVGGVAGAGAGFVLGVLPGAAIGGLVGMGIGASIAFPLCTIPGALPCFAGAIGTGIGAAAGAVIGGTIGAVVVGVPLTAAGIALGSVFGSGDPDQKIDQPWVKRDGTGKIVPLENTLEFDWEADKAVPALRGIPDAHMNVQVKEDNTWVVKLGDERWLGATGKQRDKHFYGEINKALPGVGDAIKADMESETGLFQTTIKDWMAGTAKTNPRTAQYNPKGDIKDTSQREKRIPYGESSTPDPWDEPNREKSNKPTTTVPAPPVADDGTAGNGPVTLPAQVSQTPATAEVQAPAPKPAPAPLVVTGDKNIDKAAADIQNAARQLIPGIPGA